MLGETGIILFSWGEENWQKKWLQINYSTFKNNFCKIVGLGWSVCGSNAVLKLTALPVGTER